MSETTLMNVLQEIATIKESLKSAHKRIDENDALTSKIHELTTAIQTLAIQLKIQNDRMEEMIKNFDLRMTEQGKRIGELEKKPGKRWESLVTQAISLIVAAVVGAILAKINLG